MTILRGILGIVGLIFIAWLFSRNRKGVNWVQIGKTFLLQVIIAVSIIYIPFINTVIGAIGEGFIKLLQFAGEGSKFLFGDFVDLSKFGFVFVFQVLPVTIFFSALTSLLYYYGIIQKAVKGIGYVFTRILGLSGAEGLVTAGNIFLGQTESPLLTKKYLPNMTDSEMFLVMVGGLSTIAGSVMGAYIMMLGKGDPVQSLLYAKHLVAASVLAAPAAIIMSKILFPEKSKVVKEIEISSDSVGANFFDALSNGTNDGVRMAVGIASMLLVIISVVAMLNFVVSDLVGDWTGLNAWVLEATDGRFQSFSIEYIFSILFTPIVWLMGVTTNDVPLVAKLLGQKVVLNEFIAYTSLAEMKDVLLTNSRSIMMSTYMLCGFANFSSIGIIIGGVGFLAPTKRLFITKYGLLALVGGTLAGCLSATLIGIII